MWVIESQFYWFPTVETVGNVILPEALEKNRMSNSMKYTAALY